MEPATPQFNHKLPPPDPQAGIPSGNWDVKLPPRLFATGRYPVASLNSYSKLDHLTFIHHYLKDSPVMDQIRNTCFVKLFDIPSPRCPNSGKLIHQLITRQLLTKQKHELWMVFGGHPLRFGLSEFAEITGLPCGDFEDEYNDEVAPEVANEVDATWREIIGDDANTTIGDIAELFRKKEVFDSMSDDRKFKLALIIIVDGVLVAKHQFPKPTPRYVSMLSDVEKFLQYPWGRESFLSTLQTMRPPPKSGKKLEDPIQKLRRKLGGVTYRLQGFPIALQLLAFRNIPLLLNYLPSPDEDHTLFHITGDSIPIHAGLKLNDVLLAETHPDLVVAPYLTPSDPAIMSRYKWDDEVTDNRVLYLQKRILNGDSFSLSEWPHGNASLKLLLPKPPKPKPGPHKKHIFNRRKRNNNNIHTEDPTPNKKHKLPTTKKTSPDCSKKTSTTTLVDINQMELIEEIQTLKAQVAGLLANQKRFDRERMFYRTQRLRPLRRRPSAILNTTKTVSPPLGTPNSETNEGDPWPSKWEDLPLVESYKLVKDHTATKFKNTPDKSLPPVEQNSTTGVPTKQTGTPEKTPETKMTATGEPFQPELPDQTPKVTEGEDCIVRGEIKQPEGSSTPEDGDSINISEVVQETAAKTKTINYRPKIRLRLKKITIQSTAPQSLLDTAIEEADDESENINVNHIIKKAMSFADEPLNMDTEKECNASHTSSESGETRETVLVSDSSPPPAKNKHTPTERELALAQVLREQHHIQQLSCIPPLQGDHFDMLEQVLMSSPNVEHYTDCGFLITNTFLLDLATPQKWVSTMHMEVLMNWLARRQILLPASEAGAFCSPMLINRILAKSKDFYAAKNKKRVRWDHQISQIVNTPGRTWVQDTDTVYVPMNLDNKHWVGLAINLSVGCIEVLDPNTNLKTNKNLERYLKPILDMLPYVVDKLCPQASQPKGLGSYTWKCIPDLYTNLRGGDCGPLAIKFMEMHAAGDPKPHMAGLTDETVTQFRRQYTLDVYKELIMPLYL